MPGRRPRYVPAQVVLANYFGKRHAQLPQELRALADDLAWPIGWDRLNERGRRDQAAWHDANHDPAYARQQAVGVKIGFEDALWGGLLAALNEPDDLAAGRLWARWRKRYGSRLRELIDQRLRWYAQKQGAASRPRPKRTEQKSGTEAPPSLTQDALAGFVSEFRRKHESGRGQWKAAVLHFGVSDDTLRRRRLEWRLD